MDKTESDNSIQFGKGDTATASAGYQTITERYVCDISPADINSKIYDDGDVADLAEDIRRNGVLEPLVISEDDIVISGHRRRLASLEAGIEKVPCRIFPISSADPRFHEILVAFNNQRKKTTGEIFREEVAKLDPESAYQTLLDYRSEQSSVDIDENIELLPTKKRSSISAARMPFCEAAKEVLYKYKSFHPLTVRQVHYALLNNPPTTSTGKKGFAYGNDLKSYQALSRLLTSMRLEGIVPFGWIHDETRPYSLNRYWGDVGEYIREGILKKFSKGYWRNLTQSQPNFIQVVVEKMAVQGIASPVCQKYCVPMLTSRGHSSIDARHRIAKEFKESGRGKLILLILSDFDPAGETIAESTVKSMRGDFHVKNIVASKVGLTYEQVVKFKLPPSMDAKRSSPTYANFVGKYGEGAWELEALPPDTLRQLLEQAVRSALNIDLFNAEVEKEKQEAAELAAMKGRMKEFFLDIGMDAG